MQLAADLSVSMSCGSPTLEDSSLEASSSTVHCLSGSSKELGNKIFKNDLFIATFNSLINNKSVQLIYRYNRTY
jgi:hypothetical protein